MSEILSGCAVRAAILNSQLQVSVMSKILVKFILENAEKFEWSIQGMGFLRLYLPDNCRLHVWDSRYRVPGVSMIHDHLQWGLESVIVAGELRNIKYKEVMSAYPFPEKYKYATLKAGYGCHFIHEPKEILLCEESPQTYRAGESYKQRPNEIHRTDAVDGTVTIMRKTPTETDTARVFWLASEEWGSAEPRKAEPHEVKGIVDYSLRRWFDQ